MQLGARVEELEEVLLDTLLASGVIRLLLIVFFIKVLAVAAHVLHLHRRLVKVVQRLLGKLWVLSLVTAP